jgi:hypothetical protein
MISGNIITAVALSKTAAEIHRSLFHIDALPMLVSMRELTRDKNIVADTAFFLEMSSVRNGSAADVRQTA